MTGGFRWGQWSVKGRDPRVLSIPSLNVRFYTATTTPATAPAGGAASPPHIHHPTTAGGRAATTTTPPSSASSSSTTTTVHEVNSLVAMNEKQRELLHGFECALDGTAIPPLMLRGRRYMILLESVGGSSNGGGGGGGGVVARGLNSRAATCHTSHSRGGDVHGGFGASLKVLREDDATATFSAAGADFCSIKNYRIVFRAAAPLSSKVIHLIEVCVHPCSNVTTGGGIQPQGGNQHHQSLTNRQNHTTAVERLLDEECMEEIQLALSITTHGGCSGSVSHRRPQQPTTVSFQLVSKPLLLKSSPFVTTSARVAPAPSAAVTEQQVPRGPVFELDDVSRKYWLTDCLTPSERIPRNFYDPGRSNELLTNIADYDCTVTQSASTPSLRAANQKIKIDDDEKYSLSSSNVVKPKNTKAAVPRSASRVLPREVIWVNWKEPRLVSLLEMAKKSSSAIPDSYARAQCIFWLVSSQSGGQYLAEEEAEESIMRLRRTRSSKKVKIEQTETSSSFEADFQRPRPPSSTIPRPGPTSSSSAELSHDWTNVVSLGAIKSGLCRHRGLLMKILCDLCHVPCYLLRGSHGKAGTEDVQRHVWNVVVVGEQHYLADTMLHSALLPWPDPLYHTPHGYTGSLASRLPTATAPTGTTTSVQFGGLHAAAASGGTSGNTVSSTAGFDETLFRFMEFESKVDVFEVIGEGVSSVVRRAQMGGTTVAIKLPKSILTSKANNLKNDPASEELAVLRREFHILRKLRKCPSIITALGWRGGIVMEYAPTTLHGLINQFLLLERKLSFPQQLSILRSLLNSLDCIHSRGFVHRDLKSENILLAVRRCRPDCLGMSVVCGNCQLTAKLADFADCLQIDPSCADSREEPQRRRSTAVPPTLQVDEAGRAGTEPYSSPEVESCSPFSYACDMWSLGVLAVEMAMMQLPSSSIDLMASASTHFDPSSPATTNTKNTEGTPSSAAPPMWLRQLVTGCITVDWEKRLTVGGALQLLPQKHEAQVEENPNARKRCRA